MRHMVLCLFRIGNQKISVVGKRCDANGQGYILTSCRYHERKQNLEKVTLTLASQLFYDWVAQMM